MDERELQQVVDDKRAFLKTAVEYYIKTLQAGVGWTDYFCLTHVYLVYIAFNKRWVEKVFIEMI